MKLEETSILVVDDEPELLEIFATWLADAGCPNVVCAPDGEQALALFLASRFHLLVSDLNMPRLDGIGLLRGIAESGRSIPTILFASGSSRAREKELEKFTGLVRLSKPIRRAELLAAVESRLRDL